MYLFVLNTFFHTKNNLFVFVLFQINWGSSGQAHTYRKALRLAHTLNRIDDHVKNFRPQCLVLTGLPSSRPDLVHFASYLTKHVGLMICGQINISKEGLDLPTVNQDKWLRHNKIKAFHLSMSCEFKILLFFYITVYILTLFDMGAIMPQP